MKKGMKRSKNLTSKQLKTKMGITDNVDAETIKKMARINYKF